MTLDENTKAFVRQFLISEVAQRWMTYCEKSCPKLELGKVDLESYNASLIKQAHWREALEFSQSCVQEGPLVPSYGVQPIDNSRD